MRFRGAPPFFEFFAVVEANWRDSKNGEWVPQRHQRLPFATLWRRQSIHPLIQSGIVFPASAARALIPRPCAACVPPILCFWDVPLFEVSCSLPHDPRRWKINHVSVWLRQNELNALVEPFRENCIDGQVDWLVPACLRFGAVVSKTCHRAKSVDPLAQVLIDDCNEADFESIVTFAPLRRKLKRCLEGLRQKADYVGADSESLSTMELHQGLRQLNDTMHVLASALSRPPGETYAPSYPYPAPQHFSPYPAYAAHPQYPPPAAVHPPAQVHTHYQIDAKAKPQVTGEAGKAVKTATKDSPPQQQTPATTPDPAPLSAESVEASPEPVKLASPTGGAGAGMRETLSKPCISCTDCRERAPRGDRAIGR